MSSPFQCNSLVLFARYHACPDVYLRDKFAESSTIGCPFWCAQFGLEQATRNDHAAYIGDWLAILSADPRALVSACSHAQRAIDHLNQAAGRTTPLLSEETRAAG